MKKSGWVAVALVMVSGSAFAGEVGLHLEGRLARQMIAKSTPTGKTFSVEISFVGVPSGFLVVYTEYRFNADFVCYAAEKPHAASFWQAVVGHNDLAIEYCDGVIRSDS